MDPKARRRIGLAAAVEGGARLGWRSTEPVVLQDTNNVVVWLAPHPVVAKVGMWPHSAEVLRREVAVTRPLAAAGVPVAEPLGFAVMDASWPPMSFWRRIEPAPGAVARPADLADLLRAIHAGLAALGGTVELPSFRVGLDLARSTLDDDGAMAELEPDGLAFLRATFDRLLAALGQAGPRAEVALHGEPHLGNVIVAADGLHLVNFEAVSRGPVEWDLASVDPPVAAAYGPHDERLLNTLRLLNRARVATWCWAGAAQPAMRAHGQHHLDHLRRLDRR